jgi:hypothetical protein
MTDENDIKRIQVSFETTNISSIKDQDEKPVKKRIVSQTDKWISKLSLEEQYEYIKKLQIKIALEDKISILIKQQLQQKLYGYRGQDIEKQIYQSDIFINLQEVLNLIIKSENKCYYCKKMVAILYENVREPIQWSLDRINNNYGHNKDNVLLACLNCNLRRRTMHTERYVFTKQLQIKKI